MGLLAVVGHTTRDVVDSGAARAGGVPLYAGRALAALGEKAVLITRCAERDRALLDSLQALGLPVVWRPEIQSAEFRLEYRGNERTLSIDALGEPWTPSDARGWVGEALGDADWIHAGALWRGDFPVETLAELARGRRLSLDGHALVRPARTGLIRPDADFDAATLAEVDLLHLSEDEVVALGLTLDAESLRTLGVPEIVVTLGDRGAIVVADGLFTRVPVRPLAGVDPTGAGDAFTAAYIAARRAGRGPAPSARRATEVVRQVLEERTTP